MEKHICMRCLIDGFHNESWKKRKRQLVSFNNNKIIKINY